MCYGRSGLIATQVRDRALSLASEPRAANAVVPALPLLPVQTSLVIACYGACASYLVIVGDMMSPLIGMPLGLVLS
jgi:hypothetical protein